MLRGVALSAMLAAPVSALQITQVPFEAIPGWAGDDHAAALETFVQSCGRIRAADVLDQAVWREICEVAETAEDRPRLFFEQFFQPVRMVEDAAPLFTAYFEPELEGSLTRTPRFTVPIYALPPELPERPWLTRAEIDAGALVGRGLELAWLADPVDAFFLHVQGSGRVRLPDGSVMRVGFAGRNNHPYRSVGVEMERRGLLPQGTASAGRIRSWVAANGAEGRQILHVNPSYIFFREIDRLPADQGPLGAMGRPLTPLRSIAVDPLYVPLGAPVWVSTTGADPVRRLMIAQDTGSAITGAQRADIFIGWGTEAGLRAGRFRDGGQMLVLLPVHIAERLTLDS